jgi:hypothetical protein
MSRFAVGVAAVLLTAAAVTTRYTSEGRSVTQRTAADSVHADSMARARQDSINRTRPGYVVDSILPVAEELRRFRASIGGDSAVRLTGGSTSREALVRRFVQALAADDTADLQAMAVRSREFADLYYPESPYAHAPYRESPALAWSLIQNPSASGLTRLVRRLGGKPIRYVSHRCEPTTAREGRNVRYTGCLIRLIDERGDTVTKRYFGSILARDGRYKFLSYTNQF